VPGMSIRGSQRLISRPVRPARAMPVPGAVPGLLRDDASAGGGRPCAGVNTLGGPHQAVEVLWHFVSRDALDIERLGNRQIQSFWDLG